MSKLCHQVVVVPQFLFNCPFFYFLNVIIRPAGGLKTKDKSCGGRPKSSQQEPSEGEAFAGQESTAVGAGRRLQETWSGPNAIEGFGLRDPAVPECRTRMEFQYAILLRQSNPWVYTFMELYIQHLSIFTLILIWFIYRNFAALVVVVGRRKKSTQS